MKKIIVILLFIMSILSTNIVYAENTNDEIIKEQEETLGISNFIKEAKKYTSETFEDLDISSLYKDALSGKINASGIIGMILKILGTEVTKTIRNLGYILIIIIIHSIIKSISEGMGNEVVGEVTYYIQYVLIVTLIMTNFSESIVLIKDTINNLVGFINCLLPILLSLMITTRKCCNCNSDTIYITSCYNFYWKLYNYSIITTYTCWNCTWNSIKNI